MSVALLGGRFDPPHIGHYWVAKQVLDYMPEIKKVILIPAYQHQWKPIVASTEDRMEMLKGFATESISISDLELRRGGVSYTIETIEEIKRETKGAIYWIVGADILPELPRWEKAEALTKLATFLVFPRDPYILPPELPPGFAILSHKDLVTTNLSSTLIRDRIEKKKSIHGFVPNVVEEYIREKGLYK